MMSWTSDLQDSSAAGFWYCCPLVLLSGCKTFSRDEASADFSVLRQLLRCPALTFSVFSPKSFAGLALLCQCLPCIYLQLAPFHKTRKRLNTSFLAYFCSHLESPEAMWQGRQHWCSSHCRMVRRHICRYDNIIWVLAWQVLPPGWNKQEKQQAVSSAGQVVNAAENALLSQITNGDHRNSAFFFLSTWKNTDSHSYYTEHCRKARRHLFVLKFIR